MLEGMFATFSSALPSEWNSSAAEINMIDDDGDSAKLKGNMVLVSQGAATFDEEAKRASEAGAVGVIVINTDDSLFRMPGVAGYKSKIPVLMIKSSDAVRLRENGGALIRDKGKSPSSGPGSVLSITLHVQCMCGD